MLSASPVFTSSAAQYDPRELRAVSANPAPGLTIPPEAPDHLVDQLDRRLSSLLLRVRDLHAGAQLVADGLVGPLPQPTATGTEGASAPDTGRLYGLFRQLGSLELALDALSEQLTRLHQL